MKVLFLHNYYQHLGGEDLSFEADVKMLRDRGHEVIPIIRDNHQMETPRLSRFGLGAVGMATRTIWSPSARREIAGAIAKHRPDVMHCNNLFPQFSASVYDPAQRAGVPVVQALRNFRYFCSNSFLFRDGKVCTDCLGKSCATDGIRHACYRDSRTASTAVAAMQWTHRNAGTWANKVDMYFTPSAHARDIYIRGGFDPEQIAVKTNYIDPDPGESVATHTENVALDAPILFVGRLSKEKGLDVLLDAWRSMPDAPTLQIIGDGPMRSRVESVAAETANVQCLGKLDIREIIDQLGEARCLVMPSVWYETFGRTIAESFSRGTPVIASRLGAMAELVDDGHSGWLFDAGDREDLVRQVRRLLAMSVPEMRSMRSAARSAFTSRFTADASYADLMKIYAVAASRSAAKRPTVEQAGESAGWLHAMRTRVAKWESLL